MYDKNSQQTRNREELSQLHKSAPKKSTVNGILRGEKLDFSSQDQEQGKDVLSHFSFSKGKRK